MRTFVIDHFGGSNPFREQQQPIPTVSSGQVLIQVAATSVNPIDCKIRAGLVPALAPKLPAVLHGDVAGTITEVGEGVSHLKRGDQVYACIGGIKGTLGGALADYLLADATSVALKPSSLSFGEAAALPLVSITAWEALIDRAKVAPGQRILIHGGTGGVGHIAIQLAKWIGATVYTTCSTDEKAAIAQSLGADHVINYRQQSVADYVQMYTDNVGFDLVFDTVGGENIDRSFAAAKVGGHVSTIATRTTHDLTPMHNKGLTLHAVFMALPLITGKNRLQHAFILNQVAQLVESGKLRPVIAATFPFHQVDQAHEMLESIGNPGKIILIND